jgi:excisionase family DNA binding protein
MAATFLTTHSIASIIGVSPSAVLSWIDKGFIRAHKTPGGHRRVQRKTLVAFLREQKMPVPRELTGVERLLMIDADGASLRRLSRAIEKRVPDMVVETATDAVDGLLKIGTMRPDAILLDASLPKVSVTDVVSRLRASEQTAHLLVIAVLDRPAPKAAAALEEAGVAAVITRPIDADRLVLLLEGLPAGGVR